MPTNHEFFNIDLKWDADPEKNERIPLGHKCPYQGEIANIILWEGVVRVRIEGNKVHLTVRLACLEKMDYIDPKSLKRIEDLIDKRRQEEQAA
ncbi:MAG: hypothetical protein WC526_00975 [Patescibacteria group bacterium]